MGNLQDEITARRQEISTDAYSMSIGELTNLYRDDELDVHPEFQRVYRWSSEQKSNLVESVLLGIPIPSIFVAQTEGGSWDVVDGVQRISTLLELQGLLKDEDGAPIPKLELKATRYLPTLEGKFWEHGDLEKSLTPAQRLDIRRSKVDLKIIKRESTVAAKYDLFQRLNGYGTLLTPQELRSCMIVGANRDYYNWLLSLKKYPSFVATTSLSNRLTDEQYDLELVLRYLILRDVPEAQLKRIGSVNEFLTDKAIDLATTANDLESEERRFKGTFDLLDAALEDNAFRAFNTSKNRFQGSFSNTVFEVVGLGLGHHIDQYLENSNSIDCLERVQEFWQQGGFGTGFATGKSAGDRLSRTVPRGRELFAPR